MCVHCGDVYTRIVYAVLCVGGDDWVNRGVWLLCKKTAAVSTNFSLNKSLYLCQ